MNEAGRSIIVGADDNVYPASTSRTSSRDYCSHSTTNILEA